MTPKGKKYVLLLQGSLFLTSGLAGIAMTLAQTKTYGFTFGSLRGWVMSPAQSYLVFGAFIAMGLYCFYAAFRAKPK